MLYTVVGMLFIVGWVVLKVALVFISKVDSKEINDMYKEMKPDKKDF